ncbi:hypothetical protein KIL84_023448 [Mauremys mutica]|uniref:Uncharacterized protein n=1 Tax=Mauremys mutica TaxID=74926 RepID=A0A9D3WQ16_9SAUR|nr:hypothetical protein KIL84_023448 [Mauremys mutica]
MCFELVLFEPGLDQSALTRSVRVSRVCTLMCINIPAEASAWTMQLEVSAQWEPITWPPAASPWTSLRTRSSGVAGDHRSDTPWGGTLWLGLGKLIVVSSLCQHQSIYALYRVSHGRTLFSLLTASNPPGAVTNHAETRHRTTTGRGEASGEESRQEWEQLLHVIPELEKHGSACVTLCIEVYETTHVLKLKPILQGCIGA